MNQNIKVREELHFAVRAKVRACGPQIQLLCSQAICRQIVSKLALKIISVGRCIESSLGKHGFRCANNRRDIVFVSLCSHIANL